MAEECTFKVGQMVRNTVTGTVFEVVGLPKKAGADPDREPADPRMVIVYKQDRESIRRVDWKLYEAIEEPKQAAAVAATKV